jgi:hypothetical protein
MRRGWLFALTTQGRHPREGDPDQGLDSVEIVDRERHGLTALKKNPIAASMASYAKILFACMCMIALFTVHIWRFHSLFSNQIVGIENNIQTNNAALIGVADFTNKISSSAEMKTRRTSTNSESINPQDGRNREQLVPVQERKNEMRSNETAPTKLPEALQLDPSSVTVHNDGFSNCCTLSGQRIGRRKRRPKRGVTCRGVCFTPHACTNESYPFRDEDEKMLFRRLKDRSDKEYGVWRNETFSKCLRHKPPHHRPPNQWNTTLPFPFKDSVPPPGCGIINPVAGGAFQNLYIIPRAKLAFCGIPKVGITNWLQFIRFLMGAHDYGAFPHGKPDLEMWSFDKLELGVQKRIWNDPEWTFAAILRNPAERLLSGYLDKLKVEKYNGKISKTLGFDESFTFDAFIERLEMKIPEDLSCKDKQFKPSVTGISWCTDPHWRPQVWNCGMSEKIDRFDFIGSIDQIEKHSRALLERVGLWESHGKYYRNDRSNRLSKLRDTCVSLFPLQDEFESTPLSSRHVGFQQIHRNHEDESKKKKSWDSIGHATGSSSKMKEYLTPELHRKIEGELFAADYQVWEFLDNEQGDWISGKDILPHLLLNAQQE